MDKDKQKWMEEVGFKKIYGGEKFDYYLTVNNETIFCTKQYLEDTPLETLQEAHIRNLSDLA